MELRQAILNIQEDISENIKNINAGGCGFFAYAMHTELTKLGIESEMVIILSKSETKADPEVMDYKQNIIEDYKNNGMYNMSGDGCDTSFSHCCIQAKIDGRWDNFDAEQFDAVESWDRQGYMPIGEYSKADMKVALKIGGWNMAYSRRQNPQLKRIIKKHLTFL